MKRIISTMLALTLVLACWCVPAGAASTIETRASTTICDYTAILISGTESGKIRLNFEVIAESVATSLGVETIKVYKADGSLVKTINGTVGNNLIASSRISYTNVYSITVTSGVAYYAEVTVFAKIGTAYDSRTVTTTTVIAP